MSYKNRIRPLNIRSLGQIPQGTMSDISNIAQIVSSGVATIIGATQQPQTPATTSILPVTPATAPVMPADLLAPAPQPDWVMPVVVVGGLALVGGIAFMVMRKRAVKANRGRRRMRRNRRRSRRLRGNRRSRRSRRSVRRNTGSDRYTLRWSIGFGAAERREEASVGTLAEAEALYGREVQQRGAWDFHIRDSHTGRNKKFSPSLHANTKGQHAFLYYKHGRGYYRDANGDIRSTKLKPYDERAHGSSYHQYLRDTRAKAPSKKSRRFLEMNRLTAKQRARIPLKAFVFPERRSWPINNARRAYAATQMMRLGRVRSASDFNDIRNAVRSRYPKVWDIYGRGITWERTKAAKTKSRRSRASRSTRLAANRR